MSIMPISIAGVSTLLQSEVAQQSIGTLQQQMLQYNNQAAQHANELEREILAMRGQYERDQLMLEQYDRVCTPLVWGCHFFSDFFGGG